MSFYEKLEVNRYKLNDLEEQILSYFLDYESDVRVLTIREVSKHFYTSANTISRMVKKLDFEGYSSFKEALAKIKEPKEDFLQFTDVDTQIVKTKQLINDEIINTVLFEIYNAERLYFFAVGLSRYPTEEFSERLKILGKQCISFIDPHMMRHSATMTKEGDLVIAISLSGHASSNVISATQRAKISGAKTISITGFSNNTLSKITDIQVYGYSEERRINGMDIADRLAITYLLTYMISEYIKKFYTNTNKKIQ